MFKSRRSFCERRFIPVLILPLLCGLAVAQSPPIIGSYGFGALVVGFDTGDNNGGAVLGIMNFDGAGGVSGNAVIQTRDDDGTAAAPTVPTAFSGTYSMNADGTASMKVTFDAGFDAALTLVLSDGGQEFHFADKAGQVNAGAINVTSTAQSVTATVPMALFVAGASGNIAVPLQGSSNSTSGTSFFTGGGVSGNGAARCPDGSTGTWNAAVANVTIIPVATQNGRTQGTFLINAGGTVCGRFFRLNKFGPMSGIIGAGGATNLTLRTFAETFSGTGRVAKGGALNGSYGVSFNFSPFPGSLTGVLKFDGAGSVTATLFNPNAADPISLAATSTTNPDGTGTIALTNTAGQNVSYSFVITDGGSSVLLLGTSVAPAGNLSFGTGRLQ